MVLTTRTGPREQEIQRRVIRDNATGRVIDDCVPENTSDEDLRRALPRQLSIRVELHLKDAAKMFISKGADVAEVYLPPRIAEEAGLRKYGGQVLRPGWSLDLTMIDPVSGSRWDFTKADMRERALKLVRESAPFLLIGSPPCTAFSQLQAINKGRRDPEVVRTEIETAKKHMKFVLTLYHEQIMNGRYFLHEHPGGASSWKLEDVEKLVAMPGVHVAKANMCCFGMTSKDANGQGLVKKDTKFMTNSEEIYKKLNVQCTNLGAPKHEHHRHVHLISGRARHAQTYPRQLCQAVCKGVAAQKAADLGGTREVALLEIGEMEALVGDARLYAGLDNVAAHDGIIGKEEAASRALHEVESDYWATDDVTGEALKPSLVQVARAEEIAYFKSIKAYREVQRQKCYEVTGKKPIAVRWIEINIGDTALPNYRSSLLAKELNES